jgi:hypothetical protein
MARHAFVSFFATGLIGLSGCATTKTVPPEALKFTPQSLQDRQAQTRRFDTQDEKAMLAAVSGLLQDLGFTLEESDSRLGVLVASKDRDATEAGQVALAVIFAVLTGVPIATDDEQKIRASVVTKPSTEGLAVRVTFQRIVWNTQGQVSRVEALGDAAAYQDFFEKLSKSVFLEAQEI